MNQRDIPKAVRHKLLKFEQTVEHLTEKATRTKEAIDLARERLTGGFERDSDYDDVYSTLKKLVKDLPVIESKLAAARYTLETCEAWIDELPDNATLEMVKARPSNGADLDAARERIKKAEEEVEELRAVPVPSADIKERIKQYVSSQARPKIHGIAKGQLQVSWPSDNAALLAFLLPDAMTNALMREIDRLANTPMPLDQRKKRMAELRRLIDDLQRQALALGADAYALPPQVILGVKVPKREAAKKVERRVAATGA